MRKSVYITFIVFFSVILIGLAGWYWYQQQLLTPKLVLKLTIFNRLPGWQRADLQPSFAAFKNSCIRIVKESPTTDLGTLSIHLTAADLQPICQALNKLPPQPSSQVIRQFFMTWFDPMEVYNNQQKFGLFTGYYLPTIQASLRKHGAYTVPIYGRPDDLVLANLGLFRKDLKGITLAGKVVNGNLYPYDVSREDINKGALNKKAPVLIWTNNKIDAFFMEVQGSGLAQLDNGKTLLLNYAGKNSLPYTAIGKVLIDLGQLSKKNISMQSIYAWLLSHPKKADAIMNTNQSYVFFQIAKNNTPVGAEHVPLTPGYSLAVDNHYIPYGLPLWLYTNAPSLKDSSKIEPLKRLLIAQDTGGAIKGPIRGDIYWGPGKEAAHLAGHMNSQGRYWLLLPKTVRLTKINIKN